jgi:hypothetical protein
MFPADWRSRIAEHGALGIGLDVATTAKQKSNPSGLTLMQQCGRDFVARLVLRFKTADPEVTEKVIREMLDLPFNHRVRRLCADATSEKFFVANLRKALTGLVVVEPVVSSETMGYRGESMTVKAYLGNLLVNTVEDGRLLLPNAKWLEADLRQVKRENGSFTAAVDADGNHADAFDSIKLALFALTRAGGPAAASAAAVGSGGPVKSNAWAKNPLLRFARRTARRLF